MPKLVFATVAVAFVVILASLAPRPRSPVAGDRAEAPTLSGVDMTLATPALPVAEQWDAH
jgi:hypothetical protein